MPISATLTIQARRDSLDKELGAMIDKLEQQGRVWIACSSPLTMTTGPHIKALDELELLSLEHGYSSDMKFDKW